eukprot:5314098-Heterocapsa_arctica.AAC.1
MMYADDEGEVYAVGLTALPAGELVVVLLPADLVAAEGAEEGQQGGAVPPPEPPPKSLEVRFRREAQTELHLMTHLPMN